MKNTMKYFLGITSISLLLAGCSSTPDTTLLESASAVSSENVIQEQEEASEQVESASQEESTNQEETAQKEDSESAASSDSASDTSAPEESEAAAEESDNPYAENFKAILTATANPNEKQEILIHCDDFDYNGEYEAFAFVGTVPVEGDDWGTYDGEIWYVDQNDCIRLEDQESYYHIFKEMNFEKRKYICFDRFAVTESRTIIATVKDETAYIDNYSSIGNVYDVKGNDFLISLSVYDTTYDASLGFMLGHSWKPYYFYYDEAADCLCEYGAHEIDVNEATALLPSGAMDAIAEKKGTVTTCILRDNGILNVNYEIVQEDGSIQYNNANYDTIAKSYIDAYGSDENSLENSNFGGTYELQL